jgi:hypothetical protein
MAKQKHTILMFGKSLKNLDQAPFTAISGKVFFDICI